MAEQRARRMGRKPPTIVVVGIEFRNNRNCYQQDPTAPQQSTCVFDRRAIVVDELKGLNQEKTIETIFKAIANWCGQILYEGSFGVVGIDIQDVGPRNAGTETFRVAAIENF